MMCATPALRPFFGLRDVSDLQSLVTIFVTLVVLGSGWLGLLPWWCWPFAPLGCYLSYLINHNHQHLSIFRGSRQHPFNHVIGMALSVAMGYPGSALVPLHHWNHHRENNRPTDFMWTGHARFRIGWLNLLTYPWYAAVSYRLHRRLAHAACAARDRGWLRRLWSERLLLMSMFFGSLLVNPGAALGWLLCPWLLGQFWVINANFIQHHGCDPEHPQGHARCVTGWLNFFIFNGGWHLAHHARPTLHWRLLPATKLFSHHAERSLMRLLWKMARSHV